VIDRRGISGFPVHANKNPFSREAARSVEGTPARTQREAVYDLIRDHGPIACWQLEQRLNGLHQSVSASVNYLKNNGFIVIQGMNLTPSGRRAAMYVVPVVVKQQEFGW